MIDECTSQRCCIIFFFTPSLCGVRGTSFEMHSKLKSETTNLANPNNQQQNLCENNNMASFIAAIQLGTPQTFRHEIKRKCMKFFRQIFILIFMFSYVCVCVLFRHLIAFCIDLLRSGLNAFRNSAIPVFSPAICKRVAAFPTRENLYTYAIQCCCLLRRLRLRCSIRSYLCLTVHTFWYKFVL